MTAEVRAIELFPTRLFLLPLEEGYLLIDTAYPAKYGAFRRALRRLGIPLQAIRYLLLTHAHDDHAGFAAPLLKATGAKLIVHAAELPVLAAGRIASPAESAEGRMLNRCCTLLTTLHGRLTGRSYTFPPLRPRAGDLIVEGDDAALLRRLGIAGRILWTPGHTAGSISVLLDDGRAFVGDAAMNFLRLCRTGYRPIYAEDYSQVFLSWARLLEAGARQIYPAHGRPFAAARLREAWIRWKGT